ncbi:hypothetical protein D3C71_1079160 [compost metagenome]
MQGNDIQAIEQVFTETTVAHHVLKVEVGGRKDAHIGTAGHRITDALIFLVLNKTQQLRLQCQGKVADLVEKQRSAVSLVDSAQGAFAGAGEGAAAVAEEFAFHELGGQRRAVDRDAGFLRAFAPAVNGLGQFALAGTGFTQNQDIGIGRGNLAGGFEYHFHGRAVGVQTIHGLAYLAFQGFQSRRQLPHFQLLGGCQPQLIGAARFDQIVGGASLNRIHRRVDGRVRSDDHHPHPGRLDTHLGQHIQAVVFAQTQIEEAQVEDLALQQGFCLRGAGGGGHAVAFVFEAITESTQDGGLIIHQQNAALMLSG